MRGLILSFSMGPLLAGLLSAPAAADDRAICAKERPAEAVDACTRLIEGRKPSRETAVLYINRCAAWLHRNESDRALADCDEAIRLNPAHAAGYSNRCWTWNRKNEPDRALPDCEEAIRRDPSFFYAYFHRGDAWRMKADQDRAVADYSEAIRRNPKFIHAYNNRCWVLNDKKMPDRAIADCSEAIRLDPTYPFAYNHRGNAWAAKGDYERAMADFNEAIRLNPKYAAAHWDRCAAWNSKNEPDRAIADCTEAIRLDPRSPRGHNNRCWAWNLKKDADRAIVDCTEAIRVDPKFVYSYNNRGNAFRGKGDVERAIADYSEAIRVDPKFIKPYVNRGSVYERMGSLEKALADFRAAASIDPQPVGAERIRRVEQRIAAEATKPPVAATSIGPAPEKRIALVIGNSAYANAGKLPNPKNDAETVATTLKRVGFSTVTLNLDLSRDKLIEALKAFSAEAEGADWAVVYYGGHGIEFGGVNYLVPIDARLASDRDIAFEAVALDKVLVAVEGAQKLRLIILDACRDNPFTKTMRRTNATRSLGRGLARVEPEGATLVAYAAKEGQIAHDGDGANSPFVLALTKHLETPGLEINFLFRKVRDDVLRATGRRQEPFIYGSLPAEAFYFRNP